MLRRPLTFLLALASLTILFATLLRTKTQEIDNSRPSWVHSSRPPVSDAGKAPIPAADIQKTVPAKHDAPKSPVEPPSPPPPPSKPHPIDDLIALANSEQQRIEELAQNSLADAAAAYRKRRGRHPPPGFDAWVEYAKSKDALIVEEFFDQISHDLDPFWALEPDQILASVSDWPVSLHIRNGRAVKRANPETEVSGHWVQYWLEMLKRIEKRLPDVNMPLNDIDEPRISVPWDTMKKYIAIANKKKSIAVPKSKQDVITKFPKLPPVLSGDDLPRLIGIGSPWENERPLWKIVREACPPKSPARKAEVDEDLSTPPQFPQIPPGSANGFVKNWTQSKEICVHNHLRNTYGTFVSPRYNSINTTLIPLFSGCKLQGVNNEILIPAAKYWSPEKRFSFTSEFVPWDKKLNKIIWRGQATGGRHTKANWKRFHRHRFVAMLNGSEVELEERSREMILTGDDEVVDDPNLPHNFPFPDPEHWDIAALSHPVGLGKWMKPYTDAAFNHFMCDPWKWSVILPNVHCPYIEHYYTAAEEMKMAEQFKYKYLPDVDGNSYSGRFRAFLQSASLPIKATLWTEWHDARLIAWRHFVPMDNTFIDWWGLMDYFLGYNPRIVGDESFRDAERPGRDGVAQSIATQGKDWAARVLRDEDMLVYLYRLLLEYARVCSPQREQMAFVDDLV